MQVGTSKQIHRWRTTAAAAVLIAASSTALPVSPAKPPAATLGGAGLLLSTNRPSLPGGLTLPGGFALALPQTGTNAPAPLRWFEALPPALRDARANFRSALVLFTSPDCPWCLRLKLDVLVHPEVEALLRQFTLVELDVRSNAAAAAQYAVRGAPTLVVLSGDGTQRGILSGYAPRRDVVDLLAAALGRAVVEKNDQTLQEVLALLDGDKVPAERWPDVMLALGLPTGRAPVRERLLRIAAGHRAELVGLLEHPRVTVRLGALDILEELAGEAFGFDPWRDEQAESGNAAAMARWRVWAGALAAKAADTAFAALTPDAFEAYVRDLLAEADAPERSARAGRMLIQGGASTAQALAEFLAAHPDLPPGARHRVQAVRYAILLPPIGGADAALLAHRLVFGNLDARVRAIRDLPRAGTLALPVLADLLSDPDALVREAVIEAAFKAGRDAAVPLVADHAEHEQDRDVLFALVRGLRGVKSTRGLALLARYLRHADEDLVVAAFETLAKMERKKAADDIRMGLRDRRWRVRVAALQCVEAIKPADLEKDTERLLDDPDPFVRYRAVQAFAALVGKRAVPALERVFAQADDLKGPVTAALCSLEAPIPDGFAAALADKPPSVISAVLAGLSACSGGGLPLAAGFARHADADVAVHGSGSPLYAPILVDAVRGGDRERVLTVLNGIKPTERGFSELGMYELDGDPEIVNDTSQDNASAEPVVGGTVQGIVDAFFGTGAPATNVPPSTPSPPPHAGPARPRTSLVDDVLGSFLNAGAGGTNVPASGAPAAPGPAAGDLKTAIRARLQDKDAEVRFAAACTLLRLRDPIALTEVAAGLDQRPAEQRLTIAENLSHAAGRPDALPIIRKLLKDSAQDVRGAAVGLLLKRVSSERVDILFTELTRTGTPLRVTEACSSRLRYSLQPDVVRTLRPWAERLMASPEAGWRVPLGILLLEQSWQRGDTPRVEPHLKAVDPVVRRAAWATLGRRDPEKFMQRMGEVVADSADLVREVVPAVLKSEPDSGEWLHYFTADDFVEVSAGMFRNAPRNSGGTWRGGNAAALAALRTLTGDVSAKVRFAARLALIKQGEPPDVPALAREIDGFPDAGAAAQKLLAALGDGERLSEVEIRALLPILERSESRYSALGRLRARLPEVEPDSRPTVYLRRPGGAPLPEATGSVSVARADAAAVKLVYFSRTGCRECAAARRELTQLRQALPTVQIEEHAIDKIAAMRFNETLCRRFGVPEQQRLVAPAVFCAAGFLVRDDITFPSLEDLARRSASGPETDWSAMDAATAAAADKDIETRFETMTVFLVLANGLADGLNPCAFATIIFLLSYLQVAKRTARQILTVGAAFVLAVFATYYAIGMGFAEAIRHSLLLQRAGRVFDLAMMAVLAVLAALSIRDGVLCLRGRMREMTLQLPGILKSAIHGVIRRQVRQTWMVAAAMLAGVVVSVLELACTGQVYAPTVLYILKRDPSAARASLYLLGYNLAFVTPLIAVFGLAYSGLRSETLTAWLQRHAALVKFGTAALFAAMLVMLLAR